MKIDYIFVCKSLMVFTEKRRFRTYRTRSVVFMLLYIVMTSLYALYIMYLFDKQLALQYVFKLTVNHR